MIEVITSKQEFHRFLSRNHIAIIVCVAEYTANCDILGSQIQEFASLRGIPIGEIDLEELPDLGREIGGKASSVFLYYKAEKHQELKGKGKQEIQKILTRAITLV